MGLDVEQFEDVLLGGGEAVERDALGGVGQAEALVAAGRQRGVAFG
jgi:hypothetical protein